MTRRSLLMLLGGAMAAPRSRAAVPEYVALMHKEKGLIVHSRRPLDAETPPELLDSWITPNHRFFVRTHFYIPEIDLSRWQLALDGLVEKPLAFSLEQIRRMPQVESVITIECAGNGRAYYEPHVAGIQWRKGAVGTARWKGVRLRDVLQQAGLKPDAKHIVFRGADRGMGSAPDFVRSIPVEKALHTDTLLATHMNGVPIPLEHGFPLRLITPGWEGAASPKWLTRLTASSAEAEGFFMQTAYRYPTRLGAPGAAVDPKDMAPIRSVAVKSLITHSSGPIAGFAWAGEAEIARVEVSTDGGQSWNAAKLGNERAPFAWRRFEYDWKLRRGAAVKVLARATDNRDRVQAPDPAWNPSGYLYNAPDAVPREPFKITDYIPFGEGNHVVKDRCVTCHEYDMITSQHLNQARWSAELDKMTRWGAQLPEAERKILLEWLTENYRP